jgi:hypothetical protein
MRLRRRSEAYRVQCLCGQASARAPENGRNAALEELTRAASAIQKAAAVLGWPIAEVR